MPKISVDLPKLFFIVNTMAANVDDSSNFGSHDLGSILGNGTDATVCGSTLEFLDSLRNGTIDDFLKVELLSNDSYDCTIYKVPGTNKLVTELTLKQNMVIGDFSDLYTAYSNFLSSLPLGFTNFLVFEMTENAGVDVWTSFTLATGKGGMYNFLGTLIEYDIHIINTTQGKVGDLVAKISATVDRFFKGKSIKIIGAKKDDGHKIRNAIDIEG